MPPPLRASWRRRLPTFGSLPLTPLSLIGHTVSLTLLCHFFSTHIYTVKPTYGVSMAPTMATIGDTVLISKNFRRGRNVRVGDVVNFENPFRLGDGVIKRVVGMPGDFVLRDTPGRGKGDMLQVPAGHCWVAGDNQAHSRDSRLYGPVPLALVRGKVVGRVLPFREMGRFENTLTEPLDEWE